jgi:solute carrier family 25 (mitochondrial ornithine transporter) member 2/15
MPLDLRDTASGAFGSACLVAVGQPFDTVKVRAQTATTEAERRVLGALRSLIRSEGALALWRGSVPALWSALIENSVVFTANGALKRVFAGSATVSDEDLSLSQHFLIGALSGCFSATAICPPEVLKVRAQHRASSPAYQSSLTALRSVVREEGVRGLFSGLPALLARDVPFNALFFGFYSTYCSVARTVLGVRSQGELPQWAVLICGGAAGSTAWTVVFPADSVKSRAQTAKLVGHAGESTIQSLRLILRESGVRGLYRGWSAAVLRAFPANGALFFGVELSGRLMGVRGSSTSHERA